MSQWLRGVMALGVVLAASACSPGRPSGGNDDIRGETVSVTWANDDEAAFLEMVKPWQQRTGAMVRYIGTTDVNAVLAPGVASGDLPDLAGMPGPGQMAEYARAGKLIALDDVLDMSAYQAETAPALVELGRVNGKVYGVFIEASIKGLIWYNPTLHDFSANPPTTWTDLLSQATANQGQAKATWCLGINQPGAGSGWPATDWIEDLVLRTAGPQFYTRWYQGQVRWTDPAIKNAFTLYVNDVVARTYGGGQTAAATYFGDAGDPLFASPPGCVFLHQASFIIRSGQFQSHLAGRDFNFFPFPDIDPKYAGALEGGGVPFGMVHNTQAARSLMKYLVTAEAQTIWVNKRGVLSANKNVTSYADQMSKRSAAILASASSFVFDASDSMPTAMNNAFCQGMIALTSGAKSVDQVLADLDAAQKTAYTA